MLGGTIFVFAMNCQELSNIAVQCEKLYQTAIKKLEKPYKDLVGFETLCFHCHCKLVTSLETQ